MFRQGPVGRREARTQNQVAQREWSIAMSEVVIKTAQEYEAAAEEAKHLTEALEDSPEHQRFTELVDAMEAWERNTLRAPFPF